MKFDKLFKKQSKLVQVLLLLIPGVNWVTEVLVRWSVALRTKDVVHVVLAVLAIPGLGVIMGWLDLICVLLKGHLFLAK